MERFIARLGAGGALPSLDPRPARIAFLLLRLTACDIATDPSLSRHHVNPRQSLSRIFINTDSQNADVRCSTPFQFHHKRLCGWSQPPRRLAELLRNDSARKEVTRAAMGDVDPTTVTTHIRAYWAKKKKVLDEIVLKDTLGEHSEA